MTATELNNATLADLATLLQEQHTSKVDAVVPATKMYMSDGILVVKGAEAELNLDGVTQVDGKYVPTAVFDEGIANKLNVPLSWVRRMRAERVDMYDFTVNGLLHGSKPKRLADGTIDKRYASDARSFLIRAFTGQPGIARAMLSDSYKVMDNLDVLFATLDGLKDAGVSVDVTKTSLTERRMTVMVQAPEVSMLAPELLKDYRSPFGGAMGTDNPTVFAGFMISNSETGGGAFTIVPRLVVQVCDNGMTMTKDALRAVHLGSKMDDGVINWSGETQAKATELVRLKTRDAVKTFLDVDYMTKVIAQLTEKAGKEIDDPARVIEHVSKKLAFTKDEQAGLLSHFIKGGQLTSGGVMHAITSFSQTIEDADRAFEVELTGVKSLDLI